MKQLFAFALATLAACRGADAPKPDSALARDLARAAELQSAQPLPQLNDGQPQAAPARVRAPQQPRQTETRIANAPRVRPRQAEPVAPQPAAPQPAAPQPAAPQPAAPQPAAGSSQPGFSAGASFSLASQQRICTSTNRPGDRFVATVTNTVTGANGATIPAGSNVVVQVAGVSEEGISFSVHSIELGNRNYPVNGDVYATDQLERVRTNADSDKKKVAGGAIAGALIGQIMKKNTKGTVIGAAAGAATGAVAAKMTEKYDHCLPAGATMRLTLASGIGL